jgi:hypothetical protein
MRVVSAFLATAGLVIFVSTSTAQQPKGGFGPPPQTLQADWAVVPKPPPFPGARNVTVRIRITAASFINRILVEPGIDGALDENGENPYTLVGDDGGTKWLESAHFSILVNTYTTPWQVDLSTKSKAGAVIQKKGICTLHNDSLKLSLGRWGQGRPTKFDAPEALVNIEATRVKKTG